MTSTMRFDRWEKPDASQSVSFDQLAGGTGLVPIVPSLVTAAGTGASATANILGQVTVTTAASVSLDDVFTSDYKYYRLNIEAIGSTVLDLRLRWRNSGSDITSGYAGSTWFTAVNGTSGLQNTYTSGSTGYINYLGSANYGFSTVDIAPFIRPQFLMRANSTQGGYSLTGAYYIPTQSTTGFTILTSTGTWTGTFQVFAYNE